MTSIMTNISALNGQRNLARTDVRMSRVLEKLSSGYRINRASDDAAGLAISEKMRAQIRGNQQALRNAHDGISMVRTAEGAMDEIHSLLQRIRELAVQGANGTYADHGAERTSIGEEINQLVAEIDRIAFSTEFNRQKVLTGSLSSTVAGSAATDLVAGEVIGASNAGVLGSDLLVGETLSGLVTVAGIGNPAVGRTQMVNNGGTLELRQGTTVLGTVASFASGATIGAGASSTVTFSNGTVLALNNGGAGDYSFATFLSDATAAGNDSLVFDGTGVTKIAATTAKAQTYSLSAAGTNLILTGADGTSQTLAAPTLAANGAAIFDFNQIGVQISVAAGPTGRSAAQIVANLTSAGNSSIVVVGTSNTSTLQIGSNVPETLTLAFQSMSTDQLGSAMFTLGGPGGLITTMGNQIARTGADAQNIIAAVDGAIQTLNGARGELGAAQNRLEHSIFSLGVAAENLTTSESRIRDADIAALSSDMVAASILQSAGVSVLSQANQTPQTILELLRR